MSCIPHNLYEQILEAFIEIKYIQLTKQLFKLVSILTQRRNLLFLYINLINVFHKIISNSSKISVNIVYYVIKNDK